jgi:hypothetical protein
VLRDFAQRVVGQAEEQHFGQALERVALELSTTKKKSTKEILKSSVFLLINYRVTTNWDD